jgi:hypothetical protein
MTRTPRIALAATCTAIALLMSGCTVGPVEPTPAVGP